MKTTKFCHACGSQLPITAKFCRGCGSAVSKPSEAVSQPPTSSAPIEPKLSATLQVVTPSSSSASSQSENRGVAEKSSNTIVIIVCVVAVVMAAIGYGIWAKNKHSETLGVGATEAVAVNDVSTTDKFRDDTFDTVAGKFTVRTYEDGSVLPAILLNGKKIGEGMEGSYFAVDKVFNFVDKSAVLTSYGSGTSCAASYQIFTVNKDGTYLEPVDIGDNCREISPESIVQTGTKLIFPFETNEQNMIGTETWTYDNGKVTGPVKNIRPKYDVSPSELQKIVEGDGAHNKITGTAIKKMDEQNKASYFFKFDKPVILDARLCGCNGDIVGELEIDTRGSNGVEIVPELGKGTFDAVMTCMNVWCTLDLKKATVETTPTAATESTIPKNFQGTWADAKGCAQFKAKGEFDPGATITSDHINRYEHYCTLAKVTVSSATSFSGEFTCEQEGESSNENISLTLQPDGKLVGISNSPLPKCN